MNIYKYKNKERRKNEGKKKGNTVVEIFLIWKFHRNSQNHQSQEKYQTVLLPTTSLIENKGKTTTQKIQKQQQQQLQQQKQQQLIFQMELILLMPLPLFFFLFVGIGVHDLKQKLATYL